MLYYLNIGTNLGNREQNLQRAIDAVQERFVKCLESDVVESEPWGFASDNAFLNVGVAVESDIEPLEMLQWIHRTERQLGSAAHRDAQGHYQDRLVDIDIMAIDDENGQPITIDTDVLTVPHRHLSDRPFFMQPYLQLKSKTF